MRTEYLIAVIIQAHTGFQIGIAHAMATDCVKLYPQQRTRDIRGGSSQGDEIFFLQHNLCVMGERISTRVCKDRQQCAIEHLSVAVQFKLGSRGKNNVTQHNSMCFQPANNEPVDATVCIAWWSLWMDVAQYVRYDGAEYLDGDTKTD